ncbi:MAG: hypothetical protein IIX28_02025 [Clostridia bacterium]|nr:hypothetical protein [Clostridia bacterium]
MHHKRNTLLNLCLFMVGGLTYTAVELMWRRRTHPSMFVVGGLCFHIIGRIHTGFQRRPLLLRCGLCSLAITAVELISGCILNCWLKLGVWDYSKCRGNLWGQVCLTYSFLWMLLSIPAAVLYHGCRCILSRLLRCR